MNPSLLSVLFHQIFFWSLFLATDLKSILNLGERIWGLIATNHKGLNLNHMQGFKESSFKEIYKSEIFSNKSSLMAAFAFSKVVYNRVNPGMYNATSAKVKVLVKDDIFKEVNDSIVKLNSLESKERINSSLSVNSVETLDGTLDSRTADPQLIRNYLTLISNKNEYLKQSLLLSSNALSKITNRVVSKLPKGSFSIHLQSLINVANQLALKRNDAKFEIVSILVGSSGVSVFDEESRKAKPKIKVNEYYCLYNGTHLIPICKRQASSSFNPTAKWYLCALDLILNVKVCFI